MLPFDLLDYEKPQRLDRVLGVEPKWNAWVEIHNLLSSAESIHDCGPSETLRICRKHGVKLKAAFLDERRHYYTAYLDHCLDKGDLNEGNRQLLAHLARTLFLSSLDLQPVHERAFGRTVSNVLSDDCVTFEERLLLYKLQHTLGLDPQRAEGTYEQMAREKLLSAVARALCDGMLSPEEEGSIRSLQKEFEVVIPGDVGDLLKSAKEAWNVLNGPLPKVDVGVELLPGEIGHFVASGKWKRLNYARLRVLLGSQRARFNMGETERLRIPVKALFGRQKEGQIAVVSKRLLLITRKLDLIAYEIGSLRAVERYVNGLRVGLPDDQSLFVDVGRSNVALHSILDRLISGSGPSNG